MTKLRIAAPDALAGRRIRVSRSDEGPAHLKSKLLEICSGDAESIDREKRGRRFPLSADITSAGPSDIPSRVLIALGDLSLKDGRQFEGVARRSSTSVAAAKPAWGNSVMDAGVSRD